MTDLPDFSDGDAFIYDYERIEVAEAPNQSYVMDMDNAALEARVHEIEQRSSNRGERLMRIETNVGHLVASTVEVVRELKDVRKDQRADFRWMVGIVITTFLTLLTLIAGGFGWL